MLVCKQIAGKSTDLHVESARRPEETGLGTKYCFVNKYAFFATDDGKVSKEAVFE